MNRKQRVVNFLKAAFVELSVAVIIFAIMFGAGTWLNFFLGW